MFTVVKTHSWRKTTRPILSSISVLAFACNSAFAQSNQPNPAQIFETSYFDQFAPRTAYDMLLRTPGFQINVVENRRGLGQGGVNVLLNGERLTGKNNDPEDRLGRVLANNVVRIELIDGATSGVTGLSGRVANIITRSSDLSGNWSWTPIFRNYLKPNLTGVDLSISGSKSDLNYSVTLKHLSNSQGSRGPEFRRDGSGSILDVRDEEFYGVATGPIISTVLNWEPITDVKANLELKYSDFDIKEGEVSERAMERNIAEFDLSEFSFGLDRRQGEISSDVSWPMGKGRAKAIGYYSFLNDKENSVSQRITSLGLIDANRFEVDFSSTESILRGEYDWNSSSKRSWQIAGEYARNEVTSNSRLFASDVNGSLSPVTLSDPKTNVSENRGEATLTHNWKLNNAWDLQAALGAEYSAISQTGSRSDSERSFFRPKGFATLTYSLNDSFTISSKVEREVGQLNFFDFTSSLSLEDDLEQVGNPDLVPQQSWRAEINANKVLASGHSFNVTLFAQDITDLVDRIAIGEAGDGVGNLDKASRYGIEIATTLKGEAWGWKGAELQVEFDAAKSNVRDPILGFKRSLNNDARHRFRIEFTHDIPNTPWAYGAELSQTLFEPIYRIKSIDDNYRSPFAVTYIEHKDILGLKVRASLLNASDFSIELDRTLFDSRRDIGAVLQTESRQRTFGPYLKFDVSGTF